MKGWSGFEMKGSECVWVGKWGSIPKDMSIVVEFGGPFGLAAVAFALVGRHDWSDSMVCFVYASVLLLLFRSKRAVVYCIDGRLQKV